MHLPVTSKFYEKVNGLVDVYNDHLHIAVLGLLIGMLFLFEVLLQLQ